MIEWPHILLPVADRHDADMPSLRATRIHGDVRAQLSEVLDRWSFEQEAVPADLDALAPRMLASRLALEDRDSGELVLRAIRARVHIDRNDQRLADETWTPPQPPLVWADLLDQAAQGPADGADLATAALRIIPPAPRPSAAAVLGRIATVTLFAGHEWEDSCYAGAAVLRWHRAGHDMAPVRDAFVDLWSEEWLCPHDDHIEILRERGIIDPATMRRAGQPFVDYAVQCLADGKAYAATWLTALGQSPGASAC